MCLDVVRFRVTRFGRFPYHRVDSEFLEVQIEPMLHFGRGPFNTLGYEDDPSVFAASKKNLTWAQQSGTWLELDLRHISHVDENANPRDFWSEIFRAINTRRIAQSSHDLHDIAAPCYDE